MYALCAFQGKIAVAGDFTTVGPSYLRSPYLALVNGTGWTAVAGQPNSVVTCMVHGDRLYLGGTTSGSTGTVSWFDGVSVNVIGTGFTGGSSNAGVYALHFFRNVLYAGGRFKTCEGLPCNFIAYWNETAWLPVGSGTGMNDWVYAFAEDGYDLLLVAGDFETAFDVPCDHLALFDGSNWFDLETNFGGTGVYTLTYFEDNPYPTYVPPTPTPSRTPTAGPPTSPPGTWGV